MSGEGSLRLGPPALLPREALPKAEEGPRVVGIALEILLLLLFEDDRDRVSSTTVNEAVERHVQEHRNFDSLKEAR